MAASEKKVDQIVLTQLLRLNATVQGLAAGVLLGLAIFIATNWLILKAAIGSDSEAAVGPHLALLAQYFIGYRVTFTGSLVGFAYGFAVGFAGGYLTSTIYNLLVERKERRLSAGS